MLTLWGVVWHSSYLPRYGLVVYYKTCVHNLGTHCSMVNILLFFCTEINCPDLSDIANGRVSLSGNSVGSRATYSCAAGFGLVGISPRICQLNGQWSGEEPSCQGTFGN